jgi:hypothetical protein
MAALRARANTAQVATGTALKTIMQIVAASNHRIVIPLISVSFEGISATDAPIDVQIMRQSTAGTMSALTLTKDNDSDDETLQTTAQHTATVEPTAGDVLARKLVHPQGRVDFGPFIVKGGGRLGITTTAGVTVDCVVSALIEE